MSAPLTCVDCEVEITTQDALADQVVEDDRGFHHRECVDGGSPTKSVSAEDVAVAQREGDLTPKQIEEENEARADHGDPPLWIKQWLGCWKGEIVSGYRSPEGADRLARSAHGFNSNHPGGPLSESGPRCPECGDPVDEPGRCFTCRGRSML